MTEQAKSKVEKKNSKTGEPVKKKGGKPQEGSRRDRDLNDWRGAPEFGSGPVCDAEAEYIDMQFAKRWGLKNWGRWRGEQEKKSE